MGAKESKQSCISYEDALKRVTETELRRLKDAFKKSAGVGRLYLSRKAFQQDVLCEGVPPNITEMLYTACGGTAKGISFKDLLCGLVLITRGTEEEKTKFLWNLYCNESGTYIVKSDFIRTVNLHPYDSKSLFAQNDRVNFEQFQDWIVKHREATILSKWLLTNDCVSLTSELETPTFYQSLAGVTHLEEKDIGDLEKEFWRLKNTSSNGQISRQFLGPLISPPIPKNALVGLFNAFDENRDGHIDFKELCCGVSAACRGPGVERTRFCFKIFDIDRDGVLCHEETMQMLHVLIFVAKESRNASMYKDMNKGDAVSDLLAFAARKYTAQDGEPPTSGKELNSSDTPVPTQDNLTLTAEDFMMWSVESSLKLVQPFLDLIFEVCHIVFGLWPQCRHMEYDIVRGWLQRDEKRQYRVGQFWYLISRDWWLSWMQYTQNATSACDYCRKTSSQRNSNAGVGGSSSGIDEALVCDESFNSNSLDSVATMATSELTAHAATTTANALSVASTAAGGGDNYSLGSASSGISTGRHCGLRPGPIDNTNLVIPNPYKNVRTLTGEGGHLKRDTPLVQNHDFELVPKSLWKALNRWYGDNLPLPRQVIQSPNSSQVELELYPLNLRILLHQQTTNAPTVNSWGTVSGGYGVLASGGGYAAISANSVPQSPKRYLAYTAAFSRLATIRQIGEFLCEQLQHKMEDVRLWHIPSGSMDNSAILLEEDNMMLKELMIKNNDQLLLEIRNKDQTWPEELGSLSLGQMSNVTDRRMTRTSIMSVHAPGATGLHNLGNTCFMNAALQVLFNTQPLAQYFKRDMHLYELNTTNKLGTRGQLATRYGELLKEVWTATTRSVAPLKLRFCVTKHAPQFAGGGQHDSQELLEWFLDGLHEDLNRVMEKPYSELKDSNGRPDKIVAAEAWAQHHARNQSIIIDLFYGQLKSKVSCLGCGRESVRFDPFSLLSLPLPVENYVYFEVLVILLDGSVPIKYGLRLNSECRYVDLKRKLATLCGLHPSLMLLCEISNSQIRCIIPDEEKIKTLTAKELYAYQLPEECRDRSRSSSTLGVHIEKGLKDIQRSALTSGHDSLSSLGALDATAQRSVMSAQNPYNAHYGAQNDIQGTSMSTTQQDTHTYAQEMVVYNETVASQLQMKHYPMSNGIVSTSLDDDDDNDDNDEQVATKQSPHLSRSPENTFANGVSQKTISSTKLLHHDSQTYSSSLTNNSGENSMESSTIEPMPPDPHAVHSAQEQYSNDINYRLNSLAKATTTTTATPNQFTDIRRASDQQPSLDMSGHHNYNNNNNNNGTTTEQPHSDIDSSSPFAMRSTTFQHQQQHQQQQHKIGKYLLAVHRKITRHDSYFLSYHKTRPSLFGVPLLVPNCDGGTHKDLYCAIWLQVSRLLSPLPAATDQANHAADCDDSLGYDFPFTLRAVKSDGLTCAICPWSNFCRGCEIPCNNEYVLQAPIIAGSNTSTPKMQPKFSSLPNLEQRQGNASYKPDYNTSISHTGTNAKYFDDFTIAIDWDPTALHLRYQSTLERLWTEHESVGICRKEQIEPVDLNHCLRAFTSEEKLEQWYHCSHCKGKKPATKKLQIWKLPPILIVHLKRFNNVNGKWVKSQKVVHFPFDDFDPTPYLASVPQETILRHKELLEMPKDIDEPSLEVPDEDDDLDDDDDEADDDIESDEERAGATSKDTTTANTTTSATPTPSQTPTPTTNTSTTATTPLHAAYSNNIAGNQAQIETNELLAMHLNHQRIENKLMEALNETNSYNNNTNTFTLNNNNRQFNKNIANNNANSSSIFNAAASNDNNYLHKGDTAEMLIGAAAGAGANDDHHYINTNAGTNKSSGMGKPMQERQFAHSATSTPTTHAKLKTKSAAGRRKRLISTSLAKTPIIDGEFEDFHQHKLKDGQDPFDPKYKLYAVVSHSGMLNGGHYISYGANANGNWYCYNDSSCREICNKPNIDPSSAYLLFYERVGLDYEPYLPNIEGRTLPNGSLNSLEMDESENDLKKICTIS